MTGFDAHSLIYFFYGLAFFSMGLAIMLEIGRASDVRLRSALRPLAAFGILHGTHEWLEMFQYMEHVPTQGISGLALDGFNLGLLAFSFLSLTAFGAVLMARDETMRRLSLLVPLAHAALWGLGLLALRGDYAPGAEMLGVAKAWSRYVLGVPSALVASVGLVVQQRAFRRAGMVQFGRDCLWAAVAFSWYGAVGQLFPAQSALPPSLILNEEAFLRTAGVPIQLVRGGTATLAAIFVMRFMRAFEVEIQRQIETLQAERLEEAERREALRGELLRRVVAAQEAERKRIARELHDATGQGLTAIGLGLRSVSLAVHQDVSRAEAHLGQLEILVDRALDELQDLIADLRPSHLDDLGLPAALRWYASDLQQRLPLAIQVKVVGEPRQMDSPVSTALFRITQEALTNVIKHAEADKALVCLEYAPQEVCLSVEDDGCGFEPETVIDQKSWGLMGMTERASLFGGDVLLHSSPGKGTRVQVRIPYVPQRTHEDEDKVAVG